MGKTLQYVLLTWNAEIKSIVFKEYRVMPKKLWEQTQVYVRNHHEMMTFLSAGYYITYKTSQELLDSISSRPITTIEYQTFTELIGGETHRFPKII